MVNALSNAISRTDVHSLTSMEVLVTLKDAIENDARIEAKQKRAWVDFLVTDPEGLLQPLGQGGRAQGAVRLLRGGERQPAREIPRRGGGHLG
ncbi:MAG: hypothetical protein U5L11_15815 [Arhodomonas sp.]|nr:hypothetical protein [Arhodomonas sp.]